MKYFSESEFSNFEMMDAMLVALALEIHQDDENMCALIGRHGAEHLGRGVDDRGHACARASARRQQGAWPA